MRMARKRSLIFIGVTIGCGFLYLLFKPLGLIWLVRTGGWDSWSKTLSGQIVDDGSVVYAVAVKWDFVDLVFAPLPDSAQDQNVHIQVLNPAKQSISVRCGRNNADNTGVEIDTLIHVITTDTAINAYDGLLAELYSNWIPIRVQRADGGNRIDVQLRVKADGVNNRDSIPFTVQAKWWSYGL
jgi:hypothetical protein